MFRRGATAMSTPEERGVTTISSTPAQVLSGTEIGIGEMAQCSSCARSVGEGSPVALRAHRMSDEAQWTTAMLYCDDCTTEFGTIRTSTVGAMELVLAGKLVLRGDVNEQRHWLCFEANAGRTALLDYSPATDD